MDQKLNSTKISSVALLAKLVAKLSFNFNFNSYEALFLNAPATEPATPTYL